MSVAPVGALPVGDSYYLFKGATSSKRLVITSHGGYFPGMFFNVPMATSLVFYGPDGQSLTDPGVGKVVSGKIQPYERVLPGGRTRDYIIMKYSDDNYSTLMYSARYEGVDILCVRNRWRPDRWVPKLSSVFKLLDEQNFRYSEVHCVFCRNFALNFFAKSYDPTLQP